PSASTSAGTTRIPAARSALTARWYPGSSTATTSPRRSAASATSPTAAVVPPSPRARRPCCAAVVEVGLLLESLPPTTRLVDCSPAHQYPLGRRMSAGRRVELVERARREGWLVVEDDYDGELRYDVAPLPLLAALAPDVVVHLGTTSKILTPTLGTGWMVAPPAVVTAVLEHRDRTGTSPAAAGQLVVVELARNGDLGRHLRKLRRELSERRALVVEALAAAAIPMLGDDAGAHLVVPLDSAAAERVLIDTGLRRGLLLDGLARHHSGPATWFGIALGYAACSRDQLRAAIPVLVELFARSIGSGVSPSR
ncbi:MAG TPA: aminotransferase class I/II-fold pyridoxal phosphate-dependent enzyme, partial [Actinokineospora sp.]|nr:aminotransferase class I/II-fold pyridoxal phosphate-dependent enzyme [Actinokineospora sp.]